LLKAVGITNKAVVFGAPVKRIKSNRAIIQRRKISPVFSGFSVFPAIDTYIFIAVAAPLKILK
jgi:ABC-type ATPase involved in cell division